MGVVYRAHDERLDRDVALKVLPAGALADDAARRRFRKEALALAKLAHPNIGMIFDFDTQDGVDFLAMEYVAGQSLAQKLNAGSLPEKETLALGAQVAAALEEAHEQGVVHRDLKPGNILITPKGQAKVLDFGLAKLLQPQGGAEATQTFTETQGVAGTLPYMAPEQLRGEALDARTDIYALGCVLYEMATGRRVFAEDSAPRLTDAILHGAPVGPRAISGRISLQLEAIILKCLEKDPEHRYQSAKEISVDLRRLASPTAASAAATKPAPGAAAWIKAGIGAAVGTVAVIILVAVLNIGGWRNRLQGRASTPRIESLAVLPLENLSRDPEQEYFADGMTESLITELSKIRALRVISRTSVMQYKGARKPLPQIARELGVDGVIEGSVQRAGNRVRVTAQLLHAATDRHLWAESYERDLRDVLSLESEVAQAIANEIKVKLTPQEQARLSSGVRQVNPEAYDAYLRGRYYQYMRTEEGLKRSVEYFEQAVAKDPASALAYAGLADSYSLLGNHGFLSPQQASPKAEAAALKALAMDDTLAEAHTALAFVKTNYDWDFSTAEREFKRAIELNPGYPRAHSLYAAYLGGHGRFDEALAEIKRALELDPLSLYDNTNLGWYLHKARRYDEAISQFQMTLEMDPNLLQAHLWVGQVYESKEMYGEAIAEFQKAIGLDGGSPPSLAALAHAYAVSGKRGQALSLLSRLKELELSKQEYVSAYDLAVIHTGLGDKDQAFKSLERAYEQRDGWMAFWLKTDPRLDPLRADQRFASLLRRVGLPP